MKTAEPHSWSLQMAMEIRALERARWSLRCLGVVGVVIAAVAGGAWWADATGHEQGILESESRVSWEARR